MKVKIMGDYAFRFEYETPTILFGHGSVSELETELEGRGLERALLVCGSTVGSTDAVMQPLRDGLGGKLGAVFAETTPEKRLETAFSGEDRYREADCDVIVGLGGGSSLDVAKVVAVLVGIEQSPAEVGKTFQSTGTIPVPDEGVPPVITIPTTLAGADLSMGAGVRAEPASGFVSQTTGGGVGGRPLMPTAVCYDPDLIATTPRSVLTASAMNGFDKGIETLYARNRTPITDSTAYRGLSQFQGGLLALGNGDESPDTYRELAEGVLLVQYGISRPTGSTLSIIHAFGHGLTGGFAVQQGAAHAVVAPAVLTYLFENVDGRRDLLATALGVEAEADPAEGVVSAVREVRDAMDLPSRLRDVDGPEPDDFDDVTQAILDDGFMANVPENLSPTAADIRGVLEEVW